MDRLTAGERLVAYQELVSTHAGQDGWFRAKMFPDGRISLYRAQTRGVVWSMPGLAQAGGVAVMQADGNFVAYAPDGRAYWASNTAGHPGASVVLQNDGVLAVVDAAGRTLWASNAAQDISLPTLHYTESTGYAFDETSESWKELCQQLPCSLALQWPGYSTGIVEATVGGQPAVIQWWKGWCPKFLGFLGVQAFPGGVGGEVGVYRRIPGKARPTALPFLPKPLETLVLGYLSRLADDELWWPFPEAGAQVEFSLKNPVNGHAFFSAGPEKSYWLAKWMDGASYTQYQRDQGPLQWPWLPPITPGNSKTPVDWSDYILQFKIDGVAYDSIPPQAPAPHSLPRGEIAAASRSRDKLDIFLVDPTGHVQSAAWEPDFADGWHGWWTIGTSRFPALAPISATSPRADRLDIFATGVDSVVRTATWSPTSNGWQGWRDIPGEHPMAGAAVTAVSRSPDKLDIFVVGAGDRVVTAAWDGARSPDWLGGWRPVGDLVVPAGAPVHVASRAPDKLDLFVTDAGGIVRSAAWEPAFADGWHGWWEIAGGRAAPGAAVTVVSRGRDKLDIFVVGTDGRAWTAAWDPAVAPNWRGWWPIGNVRFPAGATLHAVSRSADKIDLFGVDLGGVVRSAAWEPAFADGWHGWWEIAGGRAAPGAPVSAVVRSPDKLDVFVIGTDGRAWSAAWEPDFTGGWHGWWRIR